MMRRYLTAAALSVAVVPAVVALPTLSAPAPKPDPVAPRVSSLALRGVDAAAARALDAQGRLRERPMAGVVPPEPAALSAPRSTSAFDLVGVTWDRGAPADGARVAVRVRTAGRWSGWQPLDVSDDGPDPGGREDRAAGRAGTEPLLAPDARGIQVRVDTDDGSAPGGLRVVLVDPGRSAADAALEPAAPPASARAATPQPQVITRAQWGADERLRNCDPGVNGRVKALFLHHTAGSNSYSREGAAAVVRATYAYHTNGRGWCDIGYNFLVDRFGRIYEGRAGSIDQAVVGAHAGGFNTDTLGIAVMGNFESARPPTAVLGGVQRLMAWKAAQYEINPLGSTSLTSAGGGTSRYPAGRTVSVRTISGHRDVGRTACPGRYLYPELGAVRSAVADRMRPGLTGVVTAPASTSVGGDPITVTATVPTTQRWTLTVTPLCDQAPIRTISGRATSRLTAVWDLRDAEQVAVGPGTYTLALTARSPVGAAAEYVTDVEVLDPSGSSAGACLVRRLSGADAAGTSVAVGRAAFPAATSVVITAADSPLRALVAAPYARTTASPLLLTSRTDLSPQVRADIEARSVTRAVVVGGAGTVSRTVVAHLRALGVSVRRIAGRDRYELAANVARAMGAPGRRAFVVSGHSRDLVYGMSAAGVAAATSRPVLFVSGARVPAATRSALAALRIRDVDVVGARYSVPESARTVLAALGVGSIRRGSGGRYTTAVAVADAYANSAPEVVAVSGWVRSGLAVAMVAGQLGQVMVLTRPASVPSATATWLARANAARVTLIGRPDAVSPVTLHALYTAAR